VIHSVLGIHLAQVDLENLRVLLVPHHPLDQGIQRDRRPHSVREHPLVLEHQVSPLHQPVLEDPVVLVVQEDQDLQKIPLHQVLQLCLADHLYPWVLGLLSDL